MTGGGPPPGARAPGAVSVAAGSGGGRATVSPGGRSADDMAAPRSGPQPIYKVPAAFLMPYSSCNLFRHSCLTPARLAALMTVGNARVPGPSHVSAPFRPRTDSAGPLPVPLGPHSGPCPTGVHLSPRLIRSACPFNRLPPTD